MSRLKPETKKRYAKIIAFALPLVVIVFFLRLPFYYAVIVYAAAFFISVFIYFPNYLAIWANINFIRGNEKAARKFLKAAIKRKTKSPVAHHNYGLLLVRDGDGAGALEVLSKALELKPKVLTEKKIRLAMGSSYWVMNDIAGAIRTLEDMLERYEYVNTHVLATLGYMYFQNGETEKALEFTNKAIEEDATNAAAWDNLGQIYYLQNDLPKAKEAFETAVSHKPGLADSNFYLGLIAEKENEAETAREYFLKAKDCVISALSTVTKEQIEEKLAQPKAAPSE